MKFEIDAHSKPGATDCLAHNHYALGGHLSQCAGRLLKLLIMGMVLCLLIVAAPHPVFSQGVQLVKVDVHVVANGYRVSKLMGHAVINDKNERIGKIDDFVIGHDDGHLFTVLQVGGFLGIGSHLVAVPYDSLVIDQNGKNVELPGASKSELEKLTEFRYGT